MEYVIQPVTLSRLQELREISITTFRETFAASNSEQNMREYISKSFNEVRLAEEIGNPSSRFFFCAAGTEIAGFIKVNVAPAQTDINDNNSLEIERIYVLKQYHHAGLGRKMLHFAIDLARRDGLRYIWLGVWEHNQKAIAFYQRNGFYAQGRHTFMLGDDAQTDLIFRLDLD